MSIPDYAATTLFAAQANALASVTLQVANLNQAAQAGYLSGFKDWLLNRDHAPNSEPPKPPLALVVSYFNDPTSGPGSLGPYGDAVVQWPYPAVGTQPVCAMPPIPVAPVHTIEAGKIGNEDPTDPGWFICLPGDTTPGGKKVVGVSLDGKPGLFLKWASPFNSHPETGEVGGWFQRIG